MEQEFHQFLEIFDAKTKNQNQNQEQIQAMKDNLRQFGLERLWAFSLFVMEKNPNQIAQYYIFSTLSMLLHPLIDKGFLQNVIKTLIQYLHQGKKAVYLQVAICRCIAISCFHMVNSSNVQIILDLLKDLNSDELDISFISELCYVLKMAIDVPIFSEVEFIIITQLLPTFLKNIISFFFVSPIQQVRDILDFYFECYQQPPLLSLLNSISFQVEIDINELIFQIADQIRNEIKIIPKLIEQSDFDNSKKSNILVFFTKAIRMINDKKIIIPLFEQIVCYGLLLPLNPLVNMIDCVLKTFKDYDPSNNLYSLLFQLGLFFANGNQYSDLLSTLECLTSIVVKYEEKEGVNPDKRISSFAMVLIQKQITMIGDYDEESSDVLDNIVENVVYLTTGNPMPSLQVVINSFVDGISRIQCYWCVKLLGAFLNRYQDFEIYNDFFNELSKVTLTILSSEFMNKYAIESTAIAYEICVIFKLLPINDVASSVFDFMLLNYSDDDEVMKAALDFAKKYHFHLNTLPVNSPLSNKIMETLVSLTPNENALEWIQELMKQDDNAVRVASSIIQGLLKADIDINIEQYAVNMINRHLYSEALKICYKNVKYCVEILNQTLNWGCIEEERDQFIIVALKVGIKIVEPSITELILKQVDIKPNSDKSIKIFDLISRLFYEHKVRGIICTEYSYHFLIELITFMNNSGKIIENVLSKLFSSLNVVFIDVYRFLDDDFLKSIINLFLTYGFEETDLLYYFAMTDFNRYIRLFREVLCNVVNPDCILQLIHSELDSQPNLSEAKKMQVYQTYFNKARKAYLYMKQFVL